MTKQQNIKKLRATVQQLNDVMDNVTNIVTALGGQYYSMTSQEMSNVHHCVQCMADAKSAVTMLKHYSDAAYKAMKEASHAAKRAK